MIQTLPAVKYDVKRWAKPRSKGGTAVTRSL